MGAERPVYLMRMNRAVEEGEMPRSAANSTCGGLCSSRMCAALSLSSRTLLMDDSAKWHICNIENQSCHLCAMRVLGSSGRTRL